MNVKSLQYMFKKLVFALSIISVVACGAKPRADLSDNLDGLKPTTQHEIIAKEVAGLLENVAYKKVAMSDSLSNIVFNNLIKSLDQGKNYFLQSDIDEFEKFRNTISQDFRNGDLSAPFYIYNRYIERYRTRLTYAISQLDTKHDFAKKEFYTPSREKLDWFKSEEEANNQWRQKVKYEILNLKLTTTVDSAESKLLNPNDPETPSLDAAKDTTGNKSIETLKKRYKNLLSQETKLNANDVFQLVMTSLTDAVDPHTSYFNPSFAQAFNEGMANTFEGIGARLMVDNEVVKIMEVIPGGPIFKDKSIHIDDKIIGVAQGEKGEFEDIIGWRIDAAVAKIKGPKGTVVRLKIIPAGQDLTAHPRIVSLTREKIVVEEESAKKEIKTVKGADGKNLKVGIITIPKFYIDFDAYRKRDPNYKSTTRDVRLILDTLKQEKVDAVLIDLRFNGGGSLQESIELTGLFIDKGPVVQVRDVQNRIEVDQDEDAGVSWSGPMGVIINRFSASASEIFAGAIQDYGRGIVLGSQTYGKGTVQSAVDMSRIISPTSRLLLKAQGAKDDTVPTGAPEFGQINITLGKFYRITGSSTQHKGVSPDIAFPTQYSAEKFGESSEPAALAWDQIKSSNFTKIADLTTITKSLTAMHEARMKKSQEYLFLLEDIKTFEEKREEITKVPIQVEELKAEREDNKAKNRKRVNEMLKSRNLPLWLEGKPQPKLDFDFVKDESIQVMGDYINLSKKIQLAKK